jgi:hypothetical protein
MHFYAIMTVKLIICEVLMNMMHSSCKQHILKILHSVSLYSRKECVDAIKKKEKTTEICAHMPSRRELELLIGWSYSQIHVHCMFNNICVTNYEFFIFIYYFEINNKKKMLS